MLGGSVLSTLFAGMLADWMGRKKLMFLSGLLFVASIPMIATAGGPYFYHLLFFGRLLQGCSAGLIGVVVPLYLAECLDASSRGKGTAIFQWLLTLGIVAAAVIGFGFSLWVEEIEKLGDVQKLFAFKDVAWRSIFWVSLPPGILFCILSLVVAESPRWLFRRGRTQAALAALLRTRTRRQAETELAEMEQTVADEMAKTATKGHVKESLLRRKYIVPFLLACVILACNQLTGINSIISYNTTILIQAGLGDKAAHFAYVLFTVVNFAMTMVAIVLVDRKGRKFLLSVGSGGIILSLLGVAALFHHTERQRVDCRAALQALVADDKLSTTFNASLADKLLANAGQSGQTIRGQTLTMTVIYSYGDFVGATTAVRSDDKKPDVAVTRKDCVPGNVVIAKLTNPFANLKAAQTAPLTIQNALITPVPTSTYGWLTACCVYVFTAFYAVGPGVCVWLALSELMPTRIRSNGMSIALLLNQACSTTIAAVFLPTVGKVGYATMFFAFAAFTVIYFVTATFFLPETKGKTLEEIEEHFSGRAKS